MESGDGAATVTVLGARGWEAWVQEIISGIGPEGCLWDFEGLGELKELCGFPSLPSDPMSARPQHKMQKFRFTFELLFWDQTRLTLCPILSLFPPPPPFLVLAYQ